MDAVEAAERERSAIGKLRQFFATLVAPVELTPEQARAALYAANLSRQDVSPDDPRIAAVVTPQHVFTVAEVVELIGPSLPRGPTKSGKPRDERSSVRRMLQEARDEGLVEPTGTRGHWRTVEEPPVNWPDSDRKAGWVVTKDGNFYAI